MALSVDPGVGRQEFPDWRPVLHLVTQPPGPSNVLPARRFAHCVELCVADVLEHETHVDVSHPYLSSAYALPNGYNTEANRGKGPTVVLDLARKVYPIYR